MQLIWIGEYYDVRGRDNSLECGDLSPLFQCAIETSWVLPGVVLLG
jgi:hypothetical protein